MVVWFFFLGVTPILLSPCYKILNRQSVASQEPIRNQQFENVKIYIFALRQRSPSNILLSTVSASISSFHQNNIL